MPVEPRTYRYTSTFQTLASVVAPTDQDRWVAKASLQPLAALLPAGADLNGDDVLYLAANGATAGLVNRNSDGITAETALSIYRSAVHKYLNLEHDRETVCGTIVNAGLSRMGSNVPLTEAEAVALKEPFNLSVAGVIWKTVLPQVSRYLVKVGAATDDSALSLSWEIAFDEFKLAYGSRNLWEATIIGPDDPQWEVLCACLRTKGGTGKTPDGKDLFRVISGDAIILGYSIVEAPAAMVKGILPITKPKEGPVVAQMLPTAPAPAGSSARADTPTPVVEAPAAAPIEAAPSVAAKEEVGTTSVAVAATDTSEKIITLAETRVTTANAPMKIESIAQLKASWPDLQKQDATVALASVEGFLSAFEAANQKHLSDLNAQKDLATSLEQAKAAAEQKAAELTTALAQVQGQVEQLKQAALASEQNAKFQERMASFDEDYTLDVEDRELIASDIKGLSDEAFAAYQKKCAKLMSGKKKTATAAASTTVATTTVATASVTPATVTAAIASVTPVVQAVVPAGAPAVDVSVADEMEAAFGSSVKVGGKTIKERRAEKAASAPKE